MNTFDSRDVNAPDLTSARPPNDVISVKRRVARQFGRAADYDRVTPVQQDMGRTLLDGARARLDAWRVRRILELGCGSGALTRLLRATFPNASLTSVDLAEGMIEQARVQVPDATFIVADAESFVGKVDDGYDLIISNAAAQWFHDPATTLRAYRRKLAPGGWLAVSAFGARTFEELRASFEAAYRACGLPSREHVLSLLSYDGWRAICPDAECQQDVYVMSYPSVRAFLRAVKRAGASYPGARARSLPRAVWERMEDHYARTFPADGTAGIRATYQRIQLYAAGPLHEDHPPAMTG